MKILRNIGFYPEVYSERCQQSMMERFGKIVQGF